MAHKRPHPHLTVAARNWPDFEWRDVESRLCPFCLEGEHNRHDYYHKDGSRVYYCDCMCVEVHAAETTWSKYQASLVVWVEHPIQRNWEACETLFWRWAGEEGIDRDDHKAQQE